MSNIINKSNELYHYGILGMKWGVRRYQNEDGTLTDAGKDRYGIQSGKETYKNSSSEQKKNIKSDVKTLNKTVRKTKGTFEEKTNAGTEYLSTLSSEKGESYANAVAYKQSVNTLASSYISSGLAFVSAAASTVAISKLINS